MESIEESVQKMVEGVIETYALNAAIEAVVIVGSRSRGLEREDSDIDVAIAYSGETKEEELYGLLHEDKLYIGGVLLDVIPLNTRETGALEGWLSTEQKYLLKREWDMDQEYKEPSLALMQRNGYELLEEQGGEVYFTHIRDKETGEVYGFDGWELVHTFMEEVDEKRTFGHFVQRLEEQAEEQTDALKTEVIHMLDKAERAEGLVSIRQMIAEKKAEIAGRDKAGQTTAMLQASVGGHQLGMGN